MLRKLTVGSGPL